MATIKLITFDLDDTLWSVDGVLMRAEQGVFQWLGQHCPAVTHQYSLESLVENRLAYWKSQPALKHQISLMRRASLAHIIEGCGYSPDEAKVLSDGAFEVFMTFRHQVTLFDDALSAVEQLGKQYLLGVLSNGNACTKRLGIDGYFDFHYSAEQFNAGKPNSALFQAALDYAGATPAQMIHIGDNPKDDILGATQMGIHSIWFNREGNPWPESDYRPSLQISRLAQLPAAVGQIAR